MTRSDVHVLWNEHGPQNALRLLLERGDEDGIRYLNEVIHAWEVYAESHRKEIERVQRRARQQAERLLRAMRPNRRPVTVRRPGRVRGRARARGGRRATLRRSSARSTSDREPEPPGRPSGREAAA
jgi:hypothetical protein